MAQQETTISEQVEADGTRLIGMPDGKVVLVRPNGETVIRRPDGVTITRRPDGSHLIERPQGPAIERAARVVLAPEERPLNVASGSNEAIGRLLSNFAHTPFTLDGRAYASVEGFYQGLKFSDPVERERVAALHGREAKAAARGASASTTVYEDETIVLGSGVHHALLARALRAKLAQHPDIAAAFVATRPRPLVHHTGRRSRRPSAFPDEVFCRILSELREELANAG